MKKILCIAALLGTFQYVSAQNTFPTGVGTNVGINIGSPIYPLDVRGDVNIGTILRFANNTVTTFGTTDTHPTIYSTAATGTAYPFLGAGNLVLQARSSGSARDIVFAGSTTPAVHMVVQGATGNVGIGTATPASTLQVVGDVRLGSNIAYTDLKIANQTPLIGYNQTNIVTPLTIPGSGVAKAAFYLKNAIAGGTTRMDLLVDGNIGIGTITPLSKLQVGVPAGVATAALSNDANIFGAYSTTRGNLNIGTNDVAATDKGGLLTFSGGSGQSSDPYYFGGIRGAKETGGTYQGYMAFYTIPAGSVLTERMRINSAGNVGIGTATPGSTLDIASALAVDGATGLNMVATGSAVNQIYYGEKLNVTHSSATAGGGVVGLDIVATKSGTNSLYSATGINGIVNTGLRASGGTAQSFYGTKFVINGSAAVSSTATNVSYYGNYGEVNNTTAIGEVSNNYAIYGKASSMASGIAYGGYFTATGGTKNYGVYSAAGTNYFNDNVIIGATSVPTGYKLAVNGSVIATAVTVKLYSNWPDYVFKKDYKLLTLAQVKDYINKNQHLPGMPSEKEVAQNGLNLGEMNATLTKKVEELTLYLITKDEELKKQQQEMASQKSDIEILKQQMKDLQTLVENKCQTE